MEAYSRGAICKHYFLGGDPFQGGLFEDLRYNKVIHIKICIDGAI